MTIQDPIQQTRNELAQLAAFGVKKPNKKEAAETIAQLAATLGGDYHAQLAGLYAYFMPAPPAKPKTAFDWVAKAISPKDVREYCRYVYVTQDYITATDGHRLHWTVNTHDMEPGFYDKQGHRLKDPGEYNYPDVDRIKPNRTGALDRYKKLDPDTLDDITELHSVPGKFTGVRIDGALGLNKQYLDDARAAPGGYALAQFAYDGTGREPVFMELEKGNGEPPLRAVVMPMRLD